MDTNYPYNYNNQAPPNNNNNKGKSVGSTSSRAKKEPAMKVKYISSPIMVQANNETEFRAVVQELTGKDSPGTHPAATAGASGDGAQAGGSSSYSSLGFHQDMTWKDM